MVKQVIITNGNDATSFGTNVVNILRECGFGEWTYNGSSLMTFTYSSGVGIFGDKSAFQLYFISNYINNPYVLTYDTERQFAIICRQTYVNVSEETVQTYGKIVWYENNVLKVINITKSNERFYQSNNVCLNTSYNVTVNEMQLVPFFYYLTHVNNLFLSMYNNSSSGVVVTDGINRFLCCGGIIFLKI